jgi:hypothetical protein
MALLEVPKWEKVRGSSRYTPTTTTILQAAIRRVEKETIAEIGFNAQQNERGVMQENGK